MSNINGGNKNSPFRNADNRFPNIPHTVGNTYGDRMKNRNLNPTSSSVSRPSTPVDQFSKNRSAEAAQFASNATYKAGRRTSAGAPYKPALLNSFEEGCVPRVAKAGQPSDNALVNFLDKVIAYKKTIRA